MTSDAIARRWYVRRLDERSAWLVLSAVAGVGPRTCGSLVRRFGGAARAVAASGAELASCPGLGIARGGALARDLASVDPRAIETAALEAGLRVMTPADADYPEVVRASPDPPAALYVRGTLPRVGRPDPTTGRAADPGPARLSPPSAPAVAVPVAVAIVGTRAASPYGLRIARRLAEDLARAGVVVVSGLARGIDGAAHAGALAGGGFTIGVLGSGVDVVYPPEHHALSGEIAAHGALVSEHPPGTPPHPGHFPRRNRIVAALCAAVVVVEAPLESGALVTARLAADLGRDVLAVPGPVDRGGHAGCHRLLRDGATLVETADDVLESLGLLDPRARARGAAGPASDALPSPAGPAGVVWGALDLDDARDADDLARRTGLSPDAVARALTMLELEGRVARVVGAGFLRTR